MGKGLSQMKKRIKGRLFHQTQKRQLKSCDNTSPIKGTISEESSNLEDWWTINLLMML